MEERALKMEIFHFVEIQSVFCFELHFDALIKGSVQTSLHVYFLKTETTKHGQLTITRYLQI